MSFLFNDSVICVCCKERKQKYSFEFIHKSIGICSDCLSFIEPVPHDNPIETLENVDFLISGYYYTDAIKELVHKYKFNSEYSLGYLFSKMLYKRIFDIAQIYKYDFITCIPISSKRFKIRGFDQSQLIATEISKLLNIPYLDCVYKKRHTIAQSTLKRRDRIKNINDAFVADKRKVENKNILLFDDIYTTGLTMNECAKELRNKGASSVCGLSFATIQKNPHKSRIYFG